MNGNQDTWNEGVPLSWARFENPGDSITGTITEYNPTDGTTDFNGAPCGLMVVLQEDGVGDSGQPG